MQGQRSSFTPAEIRRLSDFGGGPCLDLTAWFRREASYGDIIIGLCAHLAVSGPYPAESVALRVALASKSYLPLSSLSTDTACTIVLHATKRLPVPISCVVMPHHSRSTLEVQASLYPATAGAFDAMNDWNGAGKTSSLASLFRSLAGWWACLIEDPHLVGASLGFEDDFAVSPNTLERYPRSFFTSTPIAESLGFRDDPIANGGLVAVPMEALR